MKIEKAEKELGFTFCYNLKMYRLKSKLSQKKLGILIGMDEHVASAAMNQYETGKHEPNFETISKISRILNICPEELFRSK